MDSTAPRLPVTARVEAEPYAPYSVLAVVAATLGGVFGLYLAARILMAFWGGEPFLQPVILAAPVAILVVAYAARRQIATSEGTRAGLGLVNFAWWVAVLGGAGYSAYLVGIQYSVRADSGNAYVAWGEALKDFDVTDPKDANFYKAFNGTLDPNEQGPARTAEPDRIFRESRKLAAYGFRQSDIVQIAARNRGAVEFEPGGLESWEQKADTYECKLAVKIHTPEGDAAGSVRLLGRRIDGTRKWSIGVVPNQPNLTSHLVTRYGQAVLDLYYSGYQFVNEGFLPLQGNIWARPYALEELQKPVRKPLNLQEMRSGVMAHASSGAALIPEPADYTERIGKFFSPVEKGDAVKEDEQRRTFVAAWKGGKIVGAPRITQSNTDQMALLVFPPGAIEMRFPLEIQSPGSEGSTSACRGTLVLRVDDPKFLADLDVLRKAGPTDPRSEAQMKAVPFGQIPWRAVRIESDMKVMVLEQPRGGGGPPGQ